MGFYPQEVLSVIASMLSVFFCSAALLLMAIVMRRTMYTGAREKLIVSLIFAGFCTSFDHLIPSSLILFKDPNILKYGITCTINGFLGQFFAQAMDLSVLAIALVTYYVLMSNDGDKALRSVVDSFRWILLVVWTIPLLTSLAGLVLVGYGPAGNWCWIAADPKAENPIPLNTVTSVRFGLTQGPRMVIFLIILFTYLRVFFRLNNRFNLTRKQTSIRNQHNNQNNGVDTQQINNNQQDTDYCGGNYSLPVSITGMTISQVKSEDNFNTNKMHSSIQSLHQAAHMGSEYSTHIEEQLREEEARNKDVMAAIYRMMLYPLIYLFFWICGLANRIVEATGNQSDVTRMMQSFSKFLPMVDAIVYCWTIKHQIREACRRN